MGPSTINIAIVHADTSARGSLCDFITDQVGFRVVGDAGQALQLPDPQRDAPVHVVVVHHADAAQEGLRRIGAARALLPQAGVVVVLAPGAEALPQDGVPAGAACLQEERVPAELVGALRTIAMGRRYTPA